MYGQLGEKEDAAKYAELAKSASGAPATAVATDKHSAATSRTRPTMMIGQRRPQGPSSDQRAMSSQNRNQPMHRTAQRPNTSQMR
jgi:hypothetical protein